MPQTSQMPVSEAPFEAQQLSEWLVKGKPELGWRGDPRLSLHIGILTAKTHGRSHKTGRFHRAGDVVAYRYEVWRHNEDGTDTELFHREAKDWHQIIPKLVGLDPRTPGHVDTATEIETNNAKIEKDKTTAYREAHGEMAEHLWKLVADRQNGRSTFYQVGKGA